MSIRVDLRTVGQTSETVIVQRGQDGALDVQPRRRRDALVARLLAAPLDARLARGVVPESGRLLATRAAYLVSPPARHELAGAWALVCERADGPTWGNDPRVPLARADVRAARPEIDELIVVLRGSAPVAARDVALARALLTDGTGPVYRSGRGLRAAVASVVAELRRLD